jgi:putative ABC transport system permease protein
MNLRRIFRKNFFYNYKVYKGYFITTTICIILFHIISSLSLNKEFLKLTTGREDNILSILAIIILLIFSCIYINYSRTMVFMSRTKEFGIYLTFGITKKEIKKLIAYENKFIVTISMSIGLIFGNAILLIFSHGLYLINSDMKYKISFINIIFTMIIFIFLFSILEVFERHKIDKVKIIKLLKINRTKQKMKYNNDFIGLVGLIILISSTLFSIYIIIKFPTVNNKIIIILVLMELIGLYAFIRNGIFFILKKLQQNKKYYYKNILAISDLKYKFCQHSKLIYILTIINIIAFIMISFSYTSYKMTHTSIVLCHPYDLVVAHNDKVDFDNILNDARQRCNLNIIKEKNIRFISQKIDAIPGTFGNMNNVLISENDTQILYGKQISVDKGHVKIIYNSSNNSFLDIKNVNIINKNSSNNYVVSEIIPKNIMNFTKRYYNKYILILNDQEFNTLIKNNNMEQKGYFRLINLTGGSRTIANEIENILYFKYNKNEGKDISYKTNSLNRNPYYVTDLESNLYYAINKQAITFYIMLFLALIFFMSSANILYYKIVLEKKNIKSRYLKLRGIGITHKETKYYIRKSIRLFFFTPTFFAIIFGVILMYTLFFKINNLGIDAYLNIFMISFLYFIVQYIFYFFTLKNVYTSIVAQHLRNT